MTYDGASHSIAYSGALPAGVSVTGYVESGVAFTGATNAGTYVISAVIVIDDADNRNLPALSATLKINKATAVIDVSGVQTVYTYNGSEQTVNSGATVNNTEQTVAYTNNKFTTVAEGNGLKVTVSVAESANYLAASATVTITVNKATLSNSVTFDDVTVTFNRKKST